MFLSRDLTQNTRFEYKHCAHTVYTKVSNPVYSAVQLYHAKQKITSDTSALQFHRKINPVQYDLRV